MHPSEAAVNDYVDETLDPRERGNIDRHLGECAACRQLAEDLREIRRMAASLDPREPPVRAWSRLERAIRVERAWSDPGHARSRRLTWQWLAAAAVLVL